MKIGICGECKTEVEWTAGGLCVDCIHSLRKERDEARAEVVRLRGQMLMGSDCPFGGSACPLAEAARDLLEKG